VLSKCRDCSALVQADHLRSSAIVQFNISQASGLSAMQL